MVDHLFGVAFASISPRALRLDEHVEAVSVPYHGAIATFIGRVRDHDPDAEDRVVALEYSAHPDARRILGELTARVAAMHPETRLSVSHRIGTLDVGDLALVAAAASAHRTQAFAACEELVETIKHELPVWKKQLEQSGEHSWVGL